MNVARKMPWALPVMGLFSLIVLGGCESFPTVPVAKNNQKSESNAIESDAIKSLQRQIKERDRRIEELTSQLEALKVIDQDFANRRKPSHPPSTTIPIE
jgi:hypothetical protein